MYEQVVKVHLGCSNLVEAVDEIVDAIEVESTEVEMIDETGGIRTVVVYVDADVDEVI